MRFLRYDEGAFKGALKALFCGMGWACAGMHLSVKEGATISSV